MQALERARPPMVEAQQNNQYRRSRNAWSDTWKAREEDDLPPARSALFDRGAAENGPERTGRR